MNYFDNLLQEYEQYGIEKNFCFSNIENQLALGEPLIVVWEEEGTKVRFSSYTEYKEFVRLNNNSSKVITIIDDSGKVNDIYDILSSCNNDYETLVSSISTIIKSNNNILSLR